MKNRKRMTDLGKRVRELYEGRGMTQREVAEDVLGLSQAALNRVMHGERPIPLSWAVKLSDYFGCTIDQIVKGVASEGQAEGKR